MHYSILKGFKNLNKVFERRTNILLIAGIWQGHFFRKKMRGVGPRGGVSPYKTTPSGLYVRKIVKGLCHAICCLFLKKKAPKLVFSSIEFHKYRSSWRLFRHCNCYLSSTSTDITSSLLSMLCQISRVRHLFTKPVLSTNSLIFSKLFCCCTVWAGIALNFAARVLTDTKKFDHTRRLFFGN